MRKGFALALVAAAFIVGCGSSAPQTTPESAAKPSTEATTPKKLSKKELAQQRAEARQKAAEAHAQSAREGKEAAASEKAKKEKEAEEAAASNAKKLVEIWKQEPAEASDSNVLSIQQHLVSLGKKCSQDIPTLAGDIHGAVETLKKEGITESPVELAVGLDKAALGRKIVPDCLGLLTAEVVLIEQSHGVG
jgi:hypothetical protein